VSLAALIRERRIAVTVGPGGVGKTTTAAALGLQAACQGRRALVLTIDPALRLADALGLPGLPPGEIRELPEAALAAAGTPARAPLAVCMLDTGLAWQRTIERLVPDLERRGRLLGHPYFRRMQANLAGAREYAALEELHHLYLRGGYELIVLDTPPTVAGVDFLQAPDRILDVLDQDGYRWLLRPALLTGKLGLRALSFSGGYAVRTISRFTGLDFLRELAGFIDLLSELLEGFRERAATMKATLRSEVTAFVLVTAADPNLAQESRYLYRRLQSWEVRPATVVVNRMTPDPGEPPPPAWVAQAGADLQAEGLAGAATLQAALRAQELLRAMHARDLAQLDVLREQLDHCCDLVPVPHLGQEVCDLAGLEQLRRRLFEPLSGGFR
jgi:anion-transporting  ArsA/GET3 family ATPase